MSCLIQLSISVPNISAWMNKQMCFEVVCVQISKNRLQFLNKMETMSGLIQLSISATSISAWMKHQMCCCLCSEFKELFTIQIWKNWKQNFFELSFSTSEAAISGWMGNKICLKFFQCNLTKLKQFMKKFQHSVFCFNFLWYVHSNETTCQLDQRLARESMLLFAFFLKSQTFCWLRLLSLITMSVSLFLSQC